MVHHTTASQSRGECKPARDATLCDPQGRGERGDERKHRCPVFASPSNLGKQDGRGDAASDKAPASRAHEHNDRRQNRELRDETVRARELVERLPHALTPEMRSIAGNSSDVRAEQNSLAAAAGSHRSDQLEVLEHAAPVVAAGSSECVAANTESAGPVATTDAVEQSAASIPDRMPRKWIKIVLRADDLAFVERAHHLTETSCIVSYVVVRDDDALRSCEPQTRHDVRDLADRSVKPRIGRNVIHMHTPRAVVRGEHTRLGVIDDDDIDAAAEPCEI